MSLGLFEPFDLQEPALQAKGGRNPAPAMGDHLADPLADPLGAPIQFEDGEGTAVHELAESGVGGGGSLPHQDTIQKSFGKHDVSGIDVSMGTSASAACEGMGASAYAMGNDIAFGSSPSVHTAAHEAAHVIQQQNGVQLDGGVGQVGDKYEQHADEVADAVVAGEDASPILDQMVGSDPSRGGVQQKVVQKSDDEEFDTGVAGRSGGEGRSKLKGAAVATGKGLWANLALYPHFTSCVDNLMAIEDKDANSPRNKVYNQIGEGWRKVDMVKEVLQLEANVFTGLAVTTGLLSLIPVLTPFLAPLATMLGVFATMFHGLTALIRICKLSRMAYKYNEVTGAQDRAAMRSGALREGTGLFINLVGVAFGAMGGVFASSGAPTGAGTNILQLGRNADSVGGMATGIGMGEIGNRIQDAAGGAMDNHADGMDKDFMLNWGKTEDGGDVDPDSPYLDDGIPLTSVYDDDSDFDDNDLYLYMAGMGRAAQFEIESDNLPKLPHESASGGLDELAKGIGNLDDKATEAEAMAEPSLVPDKAKVEAPKVEKAEESAEQNGIKTGKGGNEEDSGEPVQAKVVQMGMWSRFKNWLAGGVKRVRKIMAGIKLKMMKALGKSTGLGPAVAQVTDSLAEGQQMYEQARLGSKDSAEAGKAMKDALKDAKTKG